MDRDEQVGIRFVGYVGTLLERNEDVGRTGIDDLDVGILLFEQLSDLEHEFEVEIFLFGDLTDSPGILAAVPGIKHHGVVGLCHHRQGVGRAERRGDTIRRGGCNKGLRSHRRHRAVAAQRSADRDGVCVHGRDL